MNASFLGKFSSGFGQIFKLAKLNPHRHEIIEIYLKMNIFFQQKSSNDCTEYFYFCSLTVKSEVIATKLYHHGNVLFNTLGWYYFNQVKQ